MICISICVLFAVIVNANDIKKESAQWGNNTKLGLYSPKLDYADENIVVFHAYFGLFIYEMETEQIIDSINLDSFPYYKEYPNTDDQICVSANGEYIYLPMLQDDCIYIYDISKKEFAKEKQKEDGVTKLIDTWSRDDISDIEKSNMSEKSILFDDNTYGSLKVTGDNINDVYYIRNDKKYKLFENTEAPLGNTENQSNVYYWQYKEYAGISDQNCAVSFSNFLEKQDLYGIKQLALQNASFENISEIIKKKCYVSGIRIENTEKTSIYELQLASFLGDEDPEIWELKLKKLDGKWRVNEDLNKL